MTQQILFENNLARLTQNDHSSYVLSFKSLRIFSERESTDEIKDWLERFVESRGNIERPRTLTVDLRGLKYMGQDLLDALLSAAERLKGNGDRLESINPSYDLINMLSEVKGQKNINTLNIDLGSPRDDDIIIDMRNVDKDGRVR